MKTTIACMVALAGLASAAQGQVRMSQIFGAGGGAGGTFGCPIYSHDYVELFNAGTTAVDISGWRIQYASSTGNFSSSSNRITLPAGATIQPKGYYLVQLGSQAPSTVGGCVYLPVPADYIAPGTAAGGSTTNINASATAGKLALLDATAALLTTGNAATCASTGPGVIDYVGYGTGIEGTTTASCFEGSTGPVISLGNAFAAFRLLDGCRDNNNNSGDFTRATPNPRNAASPINDCTGIVDCDNNGVNDVTQINAAGGVGGIGGTLDCNDNGQLDACEINTGGGVNGFGGTLDCDVNGALDTCQIEANATLDCNGNNTLDSCEISNNPGLDACNNNGLIDSCEVPGTGQDCNNNNVIDCWDLKTGVLTDVDANGTADACEGAIVVEAAINATVQGAGVRQATNGNNFFNVQGTGSLTNASYGALRWANADLGNTNPARVYLYMQQSNAGFTNGGGTSDIEVAFSDNDALDISVPVSPATNPTSFNNFATDHATRLAISTYDFVPGLNPGVFGDAAGSGTAEAYKLFDSAGGNTAGGDAVAAEIASGAGNLTLVLNPVNAAVAATYAGNSNNRYRGPSLVIFPGGPAGCDTIDFNNNGVFPEDQDVIDFFDVLAGGTPGTCDPTLGCQDIDFNNNGVFPEDQDVIDFFNVLAGGTCP
ncbi:MAG TPA: lamin tail domain-containing protein [Phycisphaerales bacterium]|nr:lamin tail domain-containing protein [Phycisphaerales bacterium]